MSSIYWSAQTYVAHTIPEKYSSEGSSQDDSTSEEDILPSSQPGPPVKEGQEQSVTMSLRQVGQVVPDDSEMGYKRVPSYLYMPFTTLDLYNWKTHHASCTEKPNEMVELFTSIVASQNPTWLGI